MIHVLKILVRRRAKSFALVKLDDGWWSDTWSMLISPEKLGTRGEGTWVYDKRYRTIYFYEEDESAKDEKGLVATCKRVKQYPMQRGDEGVAWVYRGSPGLKQAPYLDWDWKVTQAPGS